MSRKYLVPAMLAIATGGFAQSSAAPTAFTDVDIDKDGVVTQAEVVTARSSIDLAKADKDKNGTLSRSEYDAGMKDQGSSESMGNNPPDSSGNTVVDLTTPN